MKKSCGTEMRMWISFKACLYLTLLKEETLWSSGLSVLAEAAAAVSCAVRACSCTTRPASSACRRDGWGFCCCICKLCTSCCNCKSHTSHYKLDHIMQRTHNTVITWGIWPAGPEDSVRFGLRQPLCLCWRFEMPSLGDSALCWLGWLE